LIEVLEHRPYAYRTSFPLDEARVRLDNGEEAVVLIKQLGRSTLDEAARRAKPPFVHDPRREIMVYERILAGRGLGTARYFGSIIKPDDDQYVLFLEKVEGVALWQLGDIGPWQRAARWAARLHAAVAPDSAVELLHYDDIYFRRWLERAHSFGADVDPHAFEAALARLKRLEPAFVHGELYPSNVLVAGERICPVDWEMAGIGPPLLDVAALTAGQPRVDFERIVRAYGAIDARDLAAARLVLAVQWLGWSPAWTAPLEHATDWAAEARAAAQELR
jgi:hypothetical protein